ncbi:unnamed protein product [Zymoseptoria tritici ST99CH_3D7]|uniref:Glycosyl transferase CAP10 domain-containing protein n=1 Tax=Zymoseptoria tritici (strain ST99CH_3D7) TaxID=1276538 RepID=A0A1X7RC33_ZYMT9|nr:unnamed protein product [Zymoseptoria tritici ST99CH_3D7]
MTSRPPFVHELSHTNTPVRCLSPAPPTPGLQPPSASSNAKLEDGKEWHSESSRSSDAADDREDYLSPLNSSSHMRSASSLSHSPPSRWREIWNPRRWRLPSRFSYQQIPSISVDSLNLDALREFREGRLPWQERRRRCGGWIVLPGRVSLSLTKAITLMIGFVVVLGLLIGGWKHARPRKEGNNDVPFFWMHYNRLNGYYNGVRTLVPFSQWVPENGWNLTEPLTMRDEEERKAGRANLPTSPPMEPVMYNPYPDYASAEYLQDHHPVATCFLDEEETMKLPEVMAYPGVPQHYPEPLFGSHKTLGLREDVCYERFGRLGPYGYGDKKVQDGYGPGTNSEHAGSEKVLGTNAHVDYTNMDWGAAQKRCYEKNKIRFAEDNTSTKTRVPRQAYILRTWEGFEYDQHYMFTLRAMINELSLKSGGEYDVHFLVHIKNNSIPIWADEATYNATLAANVPEEFRSMATLWSEAQLIPYYPDPFENNFANMAGSSIHGVYRSAHFALQWFAQQHPEYDYFWNWEMDLRYTGHYYEFHNAVDKWSTSQPRKGLWERGKRFYIPSLHGSYENFTQLVEYETLNLDKPLNNEVQSGPVPVWGPVNTFENAGMLPTPNISSPPTSYHNDKYTWGVGESADLLVFNPLFDPSTTNWVFRDDATGYLTTLPPPPRRAAIITVARLSRKLLQTMHAETFAMKHTMFPEMFAPSVALHHGFKAVFVPHPVYFDRDWKSEYAGEVFNHPKEVHESPFGWGEHNLGGSSFYYNSGFSGALWRRWLGLSENGEGGRKWEEGREGTGRMCLRGMLFHPIKHERGEVA